MDEQEVRNQIGEAYIEMLNNMSFWEKTKYTFLCIVSIIISFFRLLKYKIKGVKQ